MKKNILMLAAEHGGFSGAKVGGVGDVIRDLPQALNEQNCQVSVALPSYGFLMRLPSLKKIGSVNVVFYSYVHTVSIYSTQEAGHGVYIFDHPFFYHKGEVVYCDDPDHSPFASDASKFALFCAATAQALLDNILPKPHVVHCHDWHTGFLPLLLKKHSAFKKLNTLPIVFTIHNLAMQGTRPTSGDDSSLRAWFGEDVSDFDDCIDPVYQNCINPMRAGIVLSDKVHTVSPTYAKEILMPSDHKQGVFGGEGLESDLCKRFHEKKLIGILNGCDYGVKVGRRPSKDTLVKVAHAALLKWVAKTPQLKSTHFLAQHNLAAWHTKKTAGLTITSVGRLTEQKARLLLTPTSIGRVVIDDLLDALKGSGTFILLGSGSTEIEQQLCIRMGEYEHFIFLNGYDEDLSNKMYSYGHLFLMPSSFEPCGISQLLAMRAGQPCLVSSVGGLKDTVAHNKNGFVFSGKDDTHKAKQLVSLFNTAISMFTSKQDEYKKIQKSAKATRFTWSDVAKEYAEKLYNVD